MNMRLIILSVTALFLFQFSIFSYAIDFDDGDIYATGFSQVTQSQENDLEKITENYSVLDAGIYRQKVENARARVEEILETLDNYKNENLNTKVMLLTKALIDIPYTHVGGMGEGDWQANSHHYQPGAVHIKQDPVYQLDRVDCQTFVQVVMGFLHATNLIQFEQAILKIAYGAVGSPHGDIVHYYNRNHFVDADWNRINQHNGWLEDVTTHGALSLITSTARANVTRREWLLKQKQNPSLHIRILDEANANNMIDRFLKIYPKLDLPMFGMERVNLSYIPKEQIAIRQEDGEYIPNQALLDKIPTPAVVEIVRDTKKWFIGNKNIKEVIGSELNVSHMGFLYRETFKFGEVMYQRIACNFDKRGNKTCLVKPMKCEDDECPRLMFAHATTAYPDNYYWYSNGDGKYVCLSKPPADDIVYTHCNRVERLPFFDYLLTQQYGFRLYMDNPSILGIHIEKLT